MDIINAAGEYICKWNMYSTNSSSVETAALEHLNQCKDEATLVVFNKLHNYIHHPKNEASLGGLIYYCLKKQDFNILSTFYNTCMCKEDYVKKKK